MKALRGRLARLESRAVELALADGGFQPVDLAENVFGGACLDLSAVERARRHAEYAKAVCVVAAKIDAAMRQEAASCV